MFKMLFISSDRRVWDRVLVDCHSSPLLRRTTRSQMRKRRWGSNIVTIIPTEDSPDRETSEPGDQLHQHQQHQQHQHHHQCPLQQSRLAATTHTSGTSRSSLRLRLDPSSRSPSRSRRTSPWPDSLKWPPTTTTVPAVTSTRSESSRQTSSTICWPEWTGNRERWIYR